MVAFRDLWHNHPINRSASFPCIAPHDLTNADGEHVRKGQRVFHNQCAIRMGCALRGAGVMASQLGGCTDCSVHARDEMHFINATQLAGAIRGANLPGFGPLERFAGADTANFYPKMFR